MSQKLKVVTIGGGSSYTPELLEGFIKRYHELPVSELWLVDVEGGKAKLDIIFDLCQRMIDNAGVPMKLYKTLDRREALKDAEDSQMTPEAVLQIIEMVKSMSGADIKNLLGQLLAGLEDDNMLKKLDISKISDSDIEKLISYVIDGFPLNYRTTQLEIKNEEELVRTVNDLSIYLDKDLFDIFMPALYPMLPDVDALLKNTNIELWGQSIPLWNMIQMLTALNSMTEIEGIWNVTTRFNLGISLGDNSYKK